jgi:hypothetical protein
LCILFFGLFILVFGLCILFSGFKGTSLYNSSHLYLLS